MPCSDPRRPPEGRPNRRGMLGPVISASRMPTFNPRRLRLTASMAVTEDFPTPPLPLMIARTCSTLLNWDNLGNAGMPSGMIFFRSSSVIAPKVISTCLTPSSASNAVRASLAIRSFSGQPGMVNARVNFTVPLACSSRSRTIFSSTRLRLSSGSMTVERVLMTCSRLTISLCAPIQDYTLSILWRGPLQPAAGRRAPENRGLFPCLDDSRPARYIWCTKKPPS